MDKRMIECQEVEYCPNCGAKEEELFHAFRFFVDPKRPNTNVTVCEKCRKAWIMQEMFSPDDINYRMDVLLKKWIKNTYINHKNAIMWEWATIIFAILFVLSFFIAFGLYLRGV